MFLNLVIHFNEQQVVQLGRDLGVIWTEKYIYEQFISPEDADPADDMTTDI